MQQQQQQQKTCKYCYFIIKKKTIQCCVCVYLRRPNHRGSRFRLVRTSELWRLLNGCAFGVDERVDSVFLLCDVCFWNIYIKINTKK